MAEAIAAGAGVAAAIIQGKTALWEPLKQTIALSKDMDEIYGALDDAMQTLIAKRDDHEDMVQRHKTTMTPSNAYTNWILRVNLVAKEVNDLKAKYTKERKRSSWFSIGSRSSFTKKMRKTASRVFALMEEDTHLVDVLVDKKPACVVEMITSKITNIPTLQQPLEQTLGWLCDKRVRGIRIHGLIGSGKTTIMENLNNHVKVAEMFDIVIWVTVSREGSIENRGIDQIQQVIIQRLKLNIGVTTTIDLIASRIREELTNIKYLLLLDDVKEDLSLDKIGVPISENGSKIVFTTRLRHVCSSIATRQTNVATLNRKEALDMFKSVLDRPHLAENSNIKRLMPLIVNWCGYHPLMIKVAAGVFRVKETEESWHDGLINLRKWPEKGDDTMQEIYKLLACFFDSLKVVQKKCFFYSALYPEDSDIQKDCLLDNWAADELLDTVDDVEGTRVSGRDILDYLKMLSLVEENTQQCIRMHKLIRLAALYNLSTNEDQENLIKFGEALHKPLDVECWKNKRWISLVDSKMNALPDEPDCPKLSTLFLQKNPNLEVIPRAFFNHMQGLRVLDLYDTRISSLPSSVLNLVTLKVLYLQKCVALVELPHDIGNLQKLEVLDTRGSGLANIPPQVERLICLRRLLVSFTSSSSSSPIQEATEDIKVISKIPKLKELVIDVEEGLEKLLYGLIVNVVTLTNLSLLQFCSPNKVVDLIKAIGGCWKINFPNEKLLQKYIDKVESSKLENCQIFIGCDISSPPHIMKFMMKIQSDGTVEVDLSKSAPVASELFEYQTIEGFHPDMEFIVTDSNKSIPKLNIAVLVVGTRGDVQPFLAMSKRLQEFGHHVRLATHANFRSFVESAGVDFYPLGGDPRILAGYMARNKGLIPSAPGEIIIQRKQLKAIIESLLPACTQPDLKTGQPFRAQAIIANPPAYGHAHVAEALGVPLHMFFTMPWTPTSEFPSPLARVPQSAGNWLSYIVVDLLIWWGIRGYINDFRRKLNLAPIAYFSMYRGSISHFPTGYMWSPHVVSKPKDWGPLVDVVGYCFLNLASKYQPPEEFIQWIGKGSSPIYIGFGSMPLEDSTKTTNIILEALRRTGQRGIIDRGWGDLGTFPEIPDDVFLLVDCPHDWLFPQCAAVVHHGGAGTTATGLRAGCPTTIVPFFGDQYFWGDRIYNRGLGPTPIPISQLTVEALSDAINFMLQPEVKTRVMDLAKLIENEDGVANAVNAFHRHLPPDMPLSPPPSSKRHDDDDGYDHDDHPTLLQWFFTQIGLHCGCGSS